MISETTDMVSAGIGMRIGLGTVVAMPGLATAVTMPGVIVASVSLVYGVGRSARLRSEERQIS